MVSVNWHDQFGNLLAISIKTEYMCAIPLLITDPREMNVFEHQRICIRMLAAVLFISAFKLEIMQQSISGKNK